jgi:hypothetical protein
MTPEPTRVATLLGHRQTAYGRGCLATLARTSPLPVRFEVHSDGSLDDGDREALEALGDVRFVDPAEAAERVFALLARHPRCGEMRRTNVLARKLFDVVLLGEGPDLAYCDADVLFLRPWQGLFDRPQGTDAVFQADVQEAYSVRSWHLLGSPRLRLRRRVNTGLVLFRRAAFDLDLVEWFLARPGWQRTPPWLEQTAWALVAGRVPCALFDPQDVSLAGTPARDPVAVHYVSARRGGLAGALESWRDRCAEERVAVRTSSAGLCGPLDLFASELRRRFA